MAPSNRSAPFVGRAEELQVLFDAFEAAGAGQFVPVLIDGDAGVGKTRLVSEFVKTLPAGTEAHWGRCVEDGGAAPFWPWIQVLRSLVGSARQAEDAARADRFTAFEFVADVLRQHAAERPLVLVLDDLHVADLPSLELMRFLVRAIAEAPVLMITTHRDHELRADPERDAILGDVARFGRRLSALPLDRAEVSALLHGIAGDQLPESVVDAVLDRTGGNALFVDETARMLVSTSVDQVEGIPVGVRAVVRARLSRLPADCREVLDVAAILGVRADEKVLAALIELDPHALDDRLAPAVAIGVVSHPVDGHLVFSHGLVRDAILDDLTPRRRASWHQRAAEALVALHGAQSSVQVAAIARHYAEAVLVTGEEPAAVSASTAAGVARAIHAHEEAAAWSDRAARGFAILGRTDEQAEELARAANDLGAIGNSEGSIRRGREVTELARISGSGEMLARAALCRAAVFSIEPDREAPTLLREALDHRDNALPSRRRAELLATLAAQLGVPQPDGHSADSARARETRHELEKLAAAGVDVRDLVLETLMTTEHGPESFALRPRWLAEYEALGRTSGESLSRRVRRTFRAAALAFESGRLGDLRHEIDVFGHLAEALGVRYWEWRVAVARASEAFAHGRFAEAEERAEASCALTADLHGTVTTGVIGSIIFSARHEQGRTTTLAGPVLAQMGIVATLVHIERGDAASVASMLARQRPEVERPDRGVYWLCMMAFVVRGAAFVGDVSTCQWAVDQLVPFADQFVMFGRCNLFAGPVAELVGVAAAGAGHNEIAEHHLRNALAWAEREDAPGFATHARAALASVIDQSGHQARSEREQLLRQVIEVGTRLGMSGYVADAELSLDGSAQLDRSVEAPPRMRGPTVRTFGTFSVTPPGVDEPVRWSSKKARDALKLLVTRRGAAVMREELIELLWPGIDLTTGRNRLSVVLTMVRDALDPDRRQDLDYFLRADRDTVALRTDRLDVDLEAFLELAGRGLRALNGGDADAVVLLEHAVDRCNGQFLAEDMYEDWPAAIRAEVGAAYAAALRALAVRAEETGDRDALVLRLSQLLDHDPYDESANRTLVAALTACGRHADAQRQQAVHAARMADLS